MRNGKDQSELTFAATDLSLFGEERVAGKCLAEIVSPCLPEFCEPLEWDRMKSNVMPQEELRPVAERLFWWLPPGKALEDMPRFIAQVMTFGTWDDIQKTLKLVGEPAFRAVLENPPSGVFDEKSWHYWHVMFRIPPFLRSRIGSYAERSRFLERQLDPEEQAHEHEEGDQPHPCLDPLHRYNPCKHWVSEPLSHYKPVTKGLRQPLHKRWH
jgi:hypothetical protein